MPLRFRSRYPVIFSTICRPSGSAASNRTFNALQVQAATTSSGLQRVHGNSAATSGFPCLLAIHRTACSSSARTGQLPRSSNMISKDANIRVAQALSAALPSRDTRPRQEVYCPWRCPRRQVYQPPRVEAIVSRVTGSMRPRSVMMALMRWAGVTSKAGL